MYIVGEGLRYGFVFQVISENNTVSQRFYLLFVRNFYIETILVKNSTNLIKNLLLTKNQIFKKTFCSCNKKYFSFLFIATWVYLKVIPNWTHFYKRICLHAILTVFRYFLLSNSSGWRTFIPTQQAPYSLSMHLKGSFYYSQLGIHRCILKSRHIYSTKYQLLKNGTDVKSVLGPR